MTMRRLLQIACALCCLSVCHAADGVTGIRCHGNYSVSDDELLQIAALKTGMSVSDKDLEAARTRLLRSGHFESAEIRKRYRSLTQSGDVFLVIDVKEKVPLSKKIQFFPILQYTDEYGWTYGGRTTFENALGVGERISFPLTWGGVREAASEFQFPVRLGLADYAVGAARIHRRINPAFDLADRRGELDAGLEKRFDRLRYGLRAGWSDVDFGSVASRFASVGGGAALDTRRSTILPRNAVYAGLDWTFVDFRGANARPGVNRFRIDLRGYRAFVGRSVLAAQVLLLPSTGPLPDYLKPFIGGGETLRGYSAGRFVGDNAALASIELRIPLTPPGTLYRGGLDFFFDTGTAYNHGISLWDSRFHNGVGGGFWLFVFGLGCKIDVGYDLDHSVKVNFATGFRF